MQSFFNAFSLLPTLQSDRLILRALKPSDARDLFDYCKDPQVSRHVLWESYTALSQAKFYIKMARRQYRQGFPGTFAIVHRQDQKVIGTIGFMWINAEHRSAEIGYSLSRQYWNQGYMTEAVQLLLRYAFQSLHLNRVEAQYEIDNPASGRVMEKAGMHYEGTLRQRLKNKGRFVDVKLYAILSKDFLNQRRN